MEIFFDLISLIEDAVQHFNSVVLDYMDPKGKLSDLREKTRQLLAIRNDVKRLGLGMIKTAVIPLWLRRVEEVENKGRTFERQYELVHRRGRRCCRFPPLMFNYNLAKKITKLKQDVMSLKEGGECYLLETKAPPTHIARVMPTETRVGMESALEKVWRFLESKDVGRTGIYGMAGVGKTTLLTKIYAALRSEFHSFDAVIWVQVSKHGSLKKVQNAIAENLALSKEEDWERGGLYKKASRIFGVLKSKRFLLLLDDVWHHLDLEEVGIPPVEAYETNSKVVFTTRFFNVCSSMRADVMVRLEPLPVDEAWHLFGKAVGEKTLNSHPDIPVLAQMIVQACGGLPLAIVTIGRALASIEDANKWKETFAALNASPHNSGMGGHLFPLIKLTYDSLSGDAIKAAFLYCSLFPEEYQIDRETLVDHWISHGTLDELPTTSDRRSEGYYVVERLIHACLLGSEGNHITMHQLVRQMALKIASEDGAKGGFFVRAGLGLTEVPDDPLLEKAEKISLMDNYIEQLPYSPPWHNVTTLLLSKNKFRKIPIEFFSKMIATKVLDLSSSDIEELPPSIGSLNRLRYINLSHTKLRSLPIDFQKLKQLLFLDLSYNGRLIAVLAEVIRGLHSLEVLNMYQCGFDQREYCGQEKVKDDSQPSEHRPILVGHNEFIVELEKLDQLNNLEISIKNEHAVDKLLRSRKLTNCIGSLSIVGCRGLKSLPSSSLLLMKNIRRLEVCDCPDLNFKIDSSVVQTIISDGFLEDAYFNSLQHVKIDKCWVLDELTWIAFAPNLQSLHIEQCMNLVQVIKGDDKDKVLEIIPGAFLKLKSLYLHNLPYLESISSFPLPFPCLEEVSVSYCPELRRLPLGPNSARNSLQMIKGERQWFEELQWEDGSTREAFLPYFFYTEECE